MNQNKADYEFLYIDNAEALLKLCQIIKDAALLILDTEFIREKTYRAKLCLIQVATDDVVACIDPVAIEDLSPLMSIIHDNSKLKILHAARQDYEIFYDMDNKLPQPLFDSQLAASLLGYGEQVGYAALVNKLLGVQLDKAHTRTDWCQRPLSQAQLRYASDDVYYLRQLYPLLKKQLEEQGREDWLDDEFQSLCDPELYITHPEQAWNKVKGISRLRPRQIAAAQNIAAWREKLAIKFDKPRKWILADDILIAAAQLMPKNISQLNSIANIKKSTVENSGEAILDSVQKALQLSDTELPSIKKPKRLTPDEENVAELLMTLLKLIATEQNISPANIASRKMLEKLILGEKDIPLLKGWRYHLAGKKLKQLLNGEHCLQVINNKVMEVKSN